MHAPFYMNGSIYMLSLALAKYISTVDHNKVEWFKNTPEYQKKFRLFKVPYEQVKEKKKDYGEDMAISNLVHSHPKIETDVDTVMVTFAHHGTLGYKAYSSFAQKYANSIYHFERTGKMI